MVPFRAFPGYIHRLLSDQSDLLPNGRDMKPEVSIDRFRSLFSQSVAQTIEEAQRSVQEPLPTVTCFELATAAGKIAVSLRQIEEELYRNGSFPRIVDVAVRGIRDNAVVIWVRPSSHPLTDVLEETWNIPDGMGPFKSIGLLLPAYFWDRKQPFRISDLVEAAGVTED